jgi:hypothetical protein
MIERIESLAGKEPCMNDTTIDLIPEATQISEVPDEVLEAAAGMEAQHRSFLFSFSSSC